jgi:hypothetical protein
LLSGEDETLLIRRDTFFVLDFGLDVVNGVRRLYIERDGFTYRGGRSGIGGINTRDAS